MTIWVVTTVGNGLFYHFLLSGIILLLRWGTTFRGFVVPTPTAVQICIWIIAYALQWCRQIGVCIGVVAIAIAAKRVQSITFFYCADTKIHCCCTEILWIETVLSKKNRLSAVEKSIVKIAFSVLNTLFTHYEIECFNYSRVSSLIDIVF